MIFKFVPTNLIKAKNEIVSQHTEIGEATNAITNLELMNMIKRLTTLNEREVKEKALILTRKDLEIITRYLPHNYYKVRMYNLFLIFQLRCNLSLSWILFYEWQNAYDNEEFNEFLKKFIDHNVFFEKIMQSNHFTVQKFKDFLSEENIPLAYGRTAIELECVQSEKIKDKLNYLGIKATSRLAEDCEYVFYAFCTRSDYLTVTEQELLIRIKKYDHVIKKSFLHNFLEKLSLEDLKKYNLIAKYFLDLTGENHSEKFNAFFWNFDTKLIRKYVDWIHRYKIHKIFGNDERSLFWEQYHHEIVKEYTYSKSVVMEFDRYVAVEFLGQAMGPLYIYKKEYFENDVKKVFSMKIYDNAELRRYLFNNTDYEKNAKILGSINGTRLVHLPNPGWQSNFNSFLIKNRITERIL